MKLYKIAAKASLALTVTALSASASVKDLPVRTINGKVYHYYEVPAKETVYSLCYKLGITKDELVKNNPSVADGLKKGMVLFFPMDSDANIAGSNTATEERHGIFTHHVERGETIFGIARKYGVTTDQVIAQNPILSEGLKAGQTLTINTTPATQQAAEPIETTGINNNTATTGTSVEGYIVKKKETLYSIAHENNLTIAELEAANPGLTTLKAGFYSGLYIVFMINAYHHSGLVESHLIVARHFYFCLKFAAVFGIIEGCVVNGESVV